MITATWTNFATLSGLTSIAVPARENCTLWGICGDQAGDNVHSCDGADWTPAPGVHLTAVATTSSGSVWGVDGTATSTDNIYTYVDSQWIKPVAGTLTDICITPDGVIWGVNASQDRTSGSNVYKYSTDGQWIGVPGYLTTVRAGDDGQLWGLDSSITTGTNLFRYVGLGADGPWQAYTVGPSVVLTSLALGADGSLWGTDASNQIWALVEDEGLTQVSGSAGSIAAGDLSSVYIVDATGAVSRGAFLDEGELEVLIDGAAVLRETYVSDALHADAGHLTAGGAVTTTCEWLDPDVERRQRSARETVAGTTVRRDEKTVGDVASAIEVTKEIWQFLKDNRATWSGSHHVGSAVLNSADPNYLNYTHAKQGKTPVVSYVYKNLLGITMGRVEMQLGGSYSALAQSGNVTPGYYIPDIHFEFSKVDVRWGVNASGEAVITNLANNGGNTASDPANPYCLVVATVSYSTILRERHRTFYFSASGVDGFKLA